MQLAPAVAISALPLPTVARPTMSAAQWPAATAIAQPALAAKLHAPSVTGHVHQSLFRPCPTLYNNRHTAPQTTPTSAAPPPSTAETHLQWHRKAYSCPTFLDTMLWVIMYRSAVTETDGVIPTCPQSGCTAILRFLKPSRMTVRCMPQLQLLHVCLTAQHPAYARGYPVHCCAH